MNALFNERNNSNKSNLSSSRKKTPKKAEKKIKIIGDNSIEFLSIKRERCNLNHQLLTDEEKKFLFTRNEKDARDSVETIEKREEDRVENSEDQIFSTRNLDNKFFSKMSTQVPQEKKKEPQVMKTTSQTKKQSKNETFQSQNLSGSTNSPNNFIQYTSSTINKYFVSLLFNNNF